MNVNVSSQQGHIQIPTDGHSCTCKSKTKSETKFLLLSEQFQVLLL